MSEDVAYHTNANITYVLFITHLIFFKYKRDISVLNNTFFL